MAISESVQYLHHYLLQRSMALQQANFPPLLRYRSSCTLIDCQTILEHHFPANQMVSEQAVLAQRVHRLCIEDTRPVEPYESPEVAILIVSDGQARREQLPRHQMVGHESVPVTTHDTFTKEAKFTWSSCRRHEHTPKLVVKQRRWSSFYKRMCSNGIEIVSKEIFKFY